MINANRTPLLRRLLLTLSLLTFGIFLSAPVRGGILFTTNQVVVISAPPSVVATNSFANNLMYLFPERIPVSPTNFVVLNITKPGTYTNQTQTMLTSSNVFFFEPVESYYLHHAGFGPNVVTTGSITFDTEILGIICLSTNLAASHQQFGAIATTYQLTPGLQGFELSAATNSDRVTLSADRRTVTVTSAASGTTLDDLRIITATSIQYLIANAGPDQFVNQLDLVTLDGSASVDLNSPPLPLTYSWVQISGIPVTLTGANTVSPTFTAPATPEAGAVISFRLTVSDGGASRSDDVAVIINSVNAPPIANAGTNQLAVENSVVTLDGSSSSDPEHSVLTFQWSQVSGATVGLTNANTVHPTFRAPSVTAAQGTVQLQFQLIVNDGQVNSAASFVTVTVTNINDAPIANAGTNQTVNELTLVTLNGTASSDPDGNPLTYSWTQLLGPAVTLAGTNTAQPTFTAPQVNGPSFVTLTFRLTVSDGLASSSSTVNVRVNDTNHTPIADAGPDQTVPEGTTVTLDGTGSSDPDGDAITFSWFQLSGTNVTLSDNQSATPSFVAPEVGQPGTSLSFVLVVTDIFGRFGTNNIVIHVTDVNHPPTVNAGSDQTANEGEVVALSGTVSDADGNALAINWAQVSGPIVTLVNDTTLTPGFTVPAVTRDEANVVLRLTADDGFGGVTSDDVNIHIANINHAPIAQPPANMTVPEATQVILVGQATDPDAEEQSQLVYAWTQTAGPEVTLITEGANAGFLAPLVTDGGTPEASVTLTFALVVTDPNGAANTNSVDVVVANVNHTPTAVVGNNLTVNENSSVTLNGSASSDPDADALTFSWTQIAGPTVTLSDANTAFPQFTAPFVTAAGATLQFRLTVDDGFGGTNSATVTVTVNNINDVPNIDQAHANIASLWPPNHSMTEVSIVGVIDPNNNATIAITRVTQDEPTDGEADAIINPDGTVLLRAERSPSGNGRVYHIHFTASDFEGSNSGVVNVIVPRNKKSDSAIDDSELYDSTQ